MTISPVSECIVSTDLTGRKSTLVFMIHGIRTYTVGKAKWNPSILPLSSKVVKLKSNTIFIEGLERTMHHEGLEICKDRDFYHSHIQFAYLVYT